MYIYIHQGWKIDISAFPHFYSWMKMNFLQMKISIPRSFGNNRKKILCWRLCEEQLDIHFHMIRKSRKTWKTNANRSSIWLVTVQWKTFLMIKLWLWMSTKLAYPSFFKQALKCLIPFVTTYLWESGFSELLCMNNKYRSGFDIENGLRLQMSSV